METLWIEKFKVKGMEQHLFNDALVHQHR
uniref:Uncharacterized protein n=1 Tax=Tetranychus urticae TaxID=32264 RepID=T1K1X4_TETUR